MPKFRSFLRRQHSVQAAPQQRNRSDDSQQSRVQPESVNLDAPGFDLANVKVREVSVGCWLDAKKLRWGLHNQQDTAIIHLTIEASYPSNFEVGQFQVDLAFSPAQAESPGVSEPLNTEGESDAGQNACSIYLYGRPAPSSFPTNQDSTWNFSGHRIAPHGGLATTARWIWSALRPMSSVTSCGDLYCGVIVRHEGPEQPILIRYHIEGQARETGDARYRRPYKFSSRSHIVRPWLLKPGQALHELTDDDIESLEDEVRNRYRRHVEGVTGSNINVVTALPEAQSSGAVSEREYGPAKIGGYATVIQGDLNLGCYQTSTS